MSQAKNGDTVKVHYTGTLTDGTVFDSSVEREPLTFALGQGQLIPGFEEAVIGMSEGDKTTANIPADKAYGAPRPEMMATVERSRLPEGMDPKIGDRLQVPSEAGQPVVVTVTEVTDDSITLDGNHPLAGKDLTFEIELIEVA